MRFFRSNLIYIWACPWGPLLGVLFYFFFYYEVHHPLLLTSWAVEFWRAGNAKEEAHTPQLPTSKPVSCWWAFCEKEEKDINRLSLIPFFLEYASPCFFMACAKTVLAQSLVPLLSGKGAQVSVFAWVCTKVIWGWVPATYQGLELHVHCVDQLLYCLLNQIW